MFAFDAPLAHRRREVANFFTRDWSATLASLPEPIVILGNPPWVTASALGALGSDNLPEKSNFQNRKGLDALTGKSNFDVAEWMLLKLIEAGRGKNVTVAMLIKTGVARRVLAHLRPSGSQSFYHLACKSMEGAQLVSTLLNSEASQDLLGSLVFWDAKRPITAEILQKIDLGGLAARLGLLQAFDEIYSTGLPYSPQATLEFEPRSVRTSLH